MAFHGPRGSCASWPPTGICNTLENISLRNVIISQNAGSGIQFAAHNLGAGAPISVTFDDIDIEGQALDGVNASAVNCLGNGNIGLYIGGVQPNGTVGEVSFNRVTVRRTAQPGVVVEDKIPDPGTRFSFNSCVFDTVGRAPELCWGGPTVPLLLHESRSTPQGVGGFVFTEVQVMDALKRPFIKCDSCSTRGPAADITGSFRVVDPHGCTTALRGKQDHQLPPTVDFSVDCERTAPGLPLKADDGSLVLHWSQGDEDLARLSVDVDPNAGVNYSVTIAGQVWLRSPPAMAARLLHCDGKWTRPQRHDATRRTGVDAMGSFSALSVASAQVVREFRHYVDSGAFRFVTTFAQGCADSRLPDELNPAHDEYNASSLPLSRFPEFDASESSLLGGKLGWLTWQSRFSMDGTARGLRGILNNGSDVKRPHGTTQQYPRDNDAEYVPSNRFFGGSTGGPLVLFESSAPSANALVLSPADNFLDSILGLDQTSSPATLAGGIQGKVEAVPAATNLSFILAPTRGGVNRAMEAWGQQLRRLHNTTHNPGDIVVTKLGYWTDNGAYYDCGGAGKNRPDQATLTSVAHSLKQAEIPVRYMQLDPYWYEQSAPPSSSKTGQVGCSDAVAFRAAKDLFPDGVAGLFNATGLPLLLYTAQWSAAKTPRAYPQFRFINSSSFKVGFAQDIKSNIAPEDSRRWYSAIFGNITGGRSRCGYEAGVDYQGGDLESFTGATPASCCAACAKTAECQLWTITAPGADGRCWLKTAEALAHRLSDAERLSSTNSLNPMIGFEIDFVDSNLLTFHEFTSKLGAAAEWMNGWGEASHDHGISTQICMDIPAAALQSLLLPAVTNARASEDNFPGGNSAAAPGWQQGRWKIAYTSLFYNALELAPFMDVVWTSSKPEPGSPYQGHERNNVELQFMLAALGNGALGIGDGIGFANRTRVMQAVEEDGTLRKALRQLTPIDAMFGDASLGVPVGAEIFSTVSTFAIDTGAHTDPFVTDWQWWHVVAVNCTTPFRIGPDDLTPTPQPHVAYVAYRAHSNEGSAAACVDGASASECGVTLFGHGHPPLELSTGPLRAGLEFGFGLWRVAPLCEGFNQPTDPAQRVSGYALLGEPDKYLAV